MAVEMIAKRRETLTVLLVVLLAAVSFTAGFVANEALPFSLLEAEDDPQEFGLFWEAWNLIEDNYIGSLPGATELEYGAIHGAVASLGDPYTVFVEPAARVQERAELSGRTGGIGAELSRNEAGELILAPIPDNPAERAGILEGDVLLAVDGQAIGPEMTVGEVAQLVRGEEGTPVALTVRHPGETAEEEITVIREVILLPSVRHRLLADAPTIGYIQLARFSGESSGEVRDAIAELQNQGAEELILDLRQNGGGLLDAAVDVADHFLEPGTVLYQFSRDENEEVFRSTADTIAGAMSLVVLIDGGTASSAEIVAGALQDRDRAVLIGQPTFGKGSVQLVFDLSDGSSVHVTSARWNTPDRHQLDQVGLQPDIRVDPTEEALAAGRDETLEEAVRFLQES
jgi:carboxyl-terminal processing protease